jgi:hypothetical protein
VGRHAVAGTRTALFEAFQREGIAAHRTASRLPRRSTSRNAAEDSGLGVSVVIDPGQAGSLTSPGRIRLVGRGHHRLRDRP